jgi:hypothetical protein
MLRDGGSLALGVRARHSMLAKGVGTYVDERIPVTVDPFSL